MTNQKREICRGITAFLPPGIPEKGEKKFGNEKFSFRNLVTVMRDDRIRAENKKSVGQIANDEKLSRNHVYTVRSRK